MKIILATTMIAAGLAAATLMTGCAQLEVTRENPDGTKDSLKAKGFLTDLKGARYSSGTGSNMLSMAIDAVNPNQAAVDAIHGVVTLGEAALSIIKNGPTNAPIPVLNTNAPPK